MGGPDEGLIDSVPRELPPGHVSTGRDEAVSFMRGALFGAGLSILIVAVAALLVVLVAS